MGVWLAALVAVVAILFPYFVVSSSYAADNLEERIEITKFKVDGMDCKGCAVGLEATIRSAKGVKSATVLYEQGEAEIHYSPKETNVEKLMDVINQTGYKATQREDKGGTE